MEMIIRNTEAIKPLFSEDNMKIFPVLGNHDAFPKSQFPSNHSADDLYEQVADVWKDFLQPVNAYDSFKTKGKDSEKIEAKFTSYSMAQLNFSGPLENICTLWQLLQLYKTLPNLFSIPYLNLALQGNILYHPLIQTPLNITCQMIKKTPQNLANKFGTTKV